MGTSPAATPLVAPEPSTGSAKPQGQYHHGDLRAALITCGTQLLDTQGVAKLSLRAAAQLAGVSPAAPFHHFKDKQGFLAAIAAQGFRDLTAWRRNAPPDEAAARDPRERLRLVMRGYVEFACSHPARFNLMFGPEIPNRLEYPELVQEASASYALLKRAVEPLLEGDYDDQWLTDDFVFAVWAAAHGIAMLRINRQRGPGAGKQRSAQELTELLVQFVLAALQNLRPRPQA